MNNLKEERKDEIKKKRCRQVSKKETKQRRRQEKHMNRKERPEAQNGEVGLNYLILRCGFLYWSKYTIVWLMSESVRK